MLDLSNWSVDPYILVLTTMGFLVALVAWLPLAIKSLPLSLPIVCIVLGAALFSIPQVTDEPLPMDYPEITQRFTEFVVIIALMGAGLKLDRAFSYRGWSITWRLLAITMPLGIAAITIVGAWWLGLPWIIALLLGASLAPTDPVLAADVQVGPPKSGEEDEVRFGLTSECRFQRWSGVSVRQSRHCPWSRCNDRGAVAARLDWPQRSLGSRRGDCGRVASALSAGSPSIFLPKRSSPRLAMV